jgi:hypothetical protein
MRGALLAILLLTAPLTGCVDGGEEQGPRSAQPDWPDGLVLTYEITKDGETAEEAFLVRQTDEGPEMWAWNLSRPNLTSPFLELGTDHEPRADGWSGLFDFPIEPGDEHEAQVGGADVTMTWNETTHEGPLDTDTDLLGVARDEAGEEIGRFQVSTGNGTAITAIDVDAPDGTDERWRLVDSEVRSNWNGPPTWAKGDWWTYNGTFQDEAGQGKIVYTKDQQKRRSVQRTLEPVAFEDRVLFVPFQGWRDSDIAPQSGVVSSFLSSFWNWPLVDGVSWSGTTSAAEGGAQYQAVAEVEQRAILPDGTASTVFTVDAYVPGEEASFATFTYAPLVGHLLDWRMGFVGEEDPVMNYTLEDRGSAFHGEMEIPHVETLQQVPATSGPKRINTTFDVPEEAIWVRMAPHSFAGHGPDTEPTFELEITDPNGTVVVHRNASDFSDRRMELSGRFDAVPGTWNMTVELGEDVSISMILEAIWYETEVRDFR